MLGVYGVNLEGSGVFSMRINVGEGTEFCYPTNDQEGVLSVPYVKQDMSPFYNFYGSGSESTRLLK